MSKALIFSDIHIHAHKDRVDRLDDCLKVLDWIFEVAAQKQVDYIFFLGDLFHERSKIDARNYLKTFDVFMKHMLNDSSTRTMYLLVGNHDMYHKESCDINSVKPLSAIPRISIIQTPTSLMFDGVKIDWLPYSENPVQAIKDFQSKAGDILLSHISVSGAQTNTFYGVKSDVMVEYDNEMVAVDASLFSPWKLSLFGHYHGAQKVSDTAEYVGSPLQLSYGEAFQQKHVIILDLQTLEKEYVVNDFSPKHYIISEQEAINDAYTIDSQFIRVAVDNIGKKDLIDLQRKLSALNPLSLDFKQADKKLEDQDSSIIEEALSPMVDIKETLEKYIKEKGVPDGLDEKKLYQAGLECLQESIS